MNLIKRQSNLELLRILAMFLIVAHHFAVHGGGNLINTFDFNHFWTQALSIGGKVGVNLFVLITGYFCIKSVPKFSSIFILWVSTFFYSSLIYALFLGTGRSFSLSECIWVIFPFTFNQYWFITCYVALVALIPYINLGVKNLSRLQYLTLLVLIVVPWSILPTILSHPSLWGNKWYISDLGWFVFLYLLAGYVRLYLSEHPFLSKLGTLIPALLTGLVSTLVWIAFCDYQYSKGNHNWGWWDYFALMNNFPTLLTSISIFVLFLKLNITYSKIINTIAAAMLGVYLIHDNNFVRPWLWKIFWNVPEHLSMPPSNYIIWSIGVILVTFVACTGIELLRQKLFNQLNLYIKDKVSFIDQKIKEFFSPK